MPKQKSHITFPDNKEIEIVMRKKMKFANFEEYAKIKKQGEQKGWEIAAYQVGFYSPGYKNEIK